jgi:ABC-type glycerol-3-phosphate transport system substrate-binding protein
MIKMKQGPTTRKNLALREGDRSMNRKQVSGLVLHLLIALLLLSTAGCAGAPASSTGQSVNLKFVYLEELSGNYTQLAETFHNQNPNITVTLVSIPAFAGDPSSTFAVQIRNADAFRAPTNLMDKSITDQLLPLDALLSTDKNFPKSDQFPGALLALRLNGKQLGIPAGIEPYAVYYVPQEFKDAKVDVPGPDWTIDQFTQAAWSIQNQTDPSKLIYGFCSHPAAGADDLILFTHLFGGGLTQGPLVEKAPLVLNQPANASAAAWYADLKLKAGLLPDPASYAAIVQLIGDQHCGFWIDTLNRRRFGGETVFGSKTQQGLVNMLPLPTYKNQYNLVQVDSYSILAASAHSQEAWLWLRFLTQQPTASGMLIPPLQSQAANTANNSPERLAIAARLKDPVEWTSLWMLRDPRLGKAYDLMAQAELNILNRKAAPQTALDTAQKSIQQATP